MLARARRLSIALLTAYFGESASGGLHAVQRGFMEVLAPLQEGASRALKPARDLGGWIGDVFDAKSENKDLQRPGRGAARAACRGARPPRATRASCARSSASTARPASPTGYDQVAARVIGALADGLVLDDHDRQGLGPGRARRPAGRSPATGLVGKVSAVSSDAAQVTLITDHTSGVSAQVVPDGASGLVKATVGDPADLLLDFVQKGRAGAQGRDGGHRGLALIAARVAVPARHPDREVTRVDASERELYQRVHLRPFADLRGLDVVEVLTRRRPAAGAEARRSTP